MTAPLAYPPAHHFLRDLAIAMAPLDDGRWVATAPVDEPLRNRAGAAELGVLTAVVDIGASRVALVAAHPDWTATSNLELSATGWVLGQSVVLVGHLLRAGSRTVVVGYEVYDGAGLDGTDPLAAVASGGDDSFGHLTRAATGRIAFARIPRAASAAAALLDDSAPPGPTPALTRVDDRPTTPLLDRVGVRVVDAPGGVVEVDASEYIRNSFGAINGGVLGMVAQAAAETTRPELVATDAHIHYLSQAKTGPLHTTCDVLRTGSEHAVVTVEMRDLGAPDRPCCIATVTLQRPPS
jgi:acyl-coenzyme A thioesterase PaaI-like protein